MGFLDKAINKRVEAVIKSHNYLDPSTYSKMLGFGSNEFNQHQDEQKLINDGYGSNVTVYSIINKIVTTATTVPLGVWDIKAEEYVTKGRVYDTFKKPATYRGELLTTAEWVEVALVYLLNTGNLYQEKESLVGRTIDNLNIIPSGIIRPITPNSYLTNNNGFEVNDLQRQFRIESEDLAHLKYINPTQHGLDTLKGLSPLQAGLYSLTGSTDIQKAISVVVKNQGVKGILTNRSGRGQQNTAFTPDMAKAIKSSIQKMISGIEKFASTTVTTADLDYIQMGMSSADLKLIESGVLTDRQLCNMFAVDSKLFNDTSSSSFNNVTEANKSMYQNAIIPNLTKLVNSYNQEIVKGINREDNTNFEIRIDTSKIEALQSNQKEEADKNKINSDGIIGVLSSSTDSKGKIEILMTVYGFDEQKATTIVGNGQGTEN